MLTRDQMLGQFVRRYATVFVPVLGDSVRIRNVTDLERGRLEVRFHMAKSDADREQALREEPARWIVFCVVNDEGKRLFTERDIPEVMSQDSAFTRTVYQAIREHCGTGPTSPTVEDHEKNSGAMPDGSTSGE